MMLSRRVSPSLCLLVMLAVLVIQTTTHPVVKRQAATPTGHVASSQQDESQEETGLPQEDSSETGNNEESSENSNEAESSNVESKETASRVSKSSESSKSSKSSSRAKSSSGSKLSKSSSEAKSSKSKSSKSKSSEGMSIEETSIEETSSGEKSTTTSTTPTSPTTTSTTPTTPTTTSPTTTSPTTTSPTTTSPTTTSPTTTSPTTTSPTTTSPTTTSPTTTTPTTTSTTPTTPTTTSTTPTTPTSTSTTPTTTQPDTAQLTQSKIDEICARCYFSGLGVGYVGVSGSCSRSYYQCTQGVAGNSVQVRNCAPATVWDNEQVTCRSIYQTNCDFSTQGSCSDRPVGATWEHPDFCNMYTVCTTSGPVGVCCPPGTQWDGVSCNWPSGEPCPVVSCEITTTTSTTTTTTPTPTESATQDPCVRDQRPYFVGVTGACRYRWCEWMTPGRLVMSCCPPGTLWSQELNHCDHATHAGSAECPAVCSVTRPAVCTDPSLLLCLPFTDDMRDYSVSGFATGSRDASLTHSTILSSSVLDCTDLKCLVEIYAFNNLFNGNELQKLTITLSFMTVGSGQRGRELVGNGDCRQPGTIGVELVEEDGGLRVLAFVNGRNNNVTLQKPVTSGEWHDVIVEFDGSKELLKLWLDDDYSEAEVDADTVQNSHSSLYLGRADCEDDTSHEGPGLYLSMVRVWKKLLSPSDLV